MSMNLRRAYSNFALDSCVASCFDNSLCIASKLLFVYILTGLTVTKLRSPYMPTVTLYEGPR